MQGITRVPIDGSDQQDDIESVTRGISERYMNDDQTNILAIIPANQDVSTSDALQLARSVDPYGTRESAFGGLVPALEEFNDTSPTSET